MLYIAASGVIYAPEDSSYLFEFSIYNENESTYITSLEAIDFGECFDTSKVTDMEAMFEGCMSCLLYTSRCV